MPDKVSQLIAEARRLLHPSEVRLHHVPNWFRLLAIKSFRIPRDYHSGAGVIMFLSMRGSTRWLDHWGSTNWGKHSAFASEPYDLSLEIIQQVAKIADIMGIEYHISPMSWWYPGRTFRILLFRKPDEGTEMPDDWMRRSLKEPPKEN